MRNGKIELEKMLPIGVVCDERVCSGAYYAKAFAEVKRLLKNPELLENTDYQIRNLEDLIVETP